MCEIVAVQELESERWAGSARPWDIFGDGSPVLRPDYVNDNSPLHHPRTSAFFIRKLSNSPWVEGLYLAISTEVPITANELILDCLRLGLDGEKVDYDWEQNNQEAVVLKFEDSQKVRITLENVE